MTPAKFQSLCISKYGWHGWQRKLAKETGKSKSTVSRWSTGETKIPDWVVKMVKHKERV